MHIHTIIFILRIFFFQLVASKYLTDEGESNEIYNNDWAEVCDIPIKRINQLERSFLNQMVSKHYRKSQIHTYTSKKVSNLWLHFVHLAHSELGVVRVQQRILVLCQRTHRKVRIHSCFFYIKTMISYELHNSFYSLVRAWRTTRKKVKSQQNQCTYSDLDVLLRYSSEFTLAAIKEHLVLLSQVIVVCSSTLVYVAMSSFVTYAYVLYVHTQLQLMYSSTTLDMSAAVATHTQNNVCLNSSNANVNGARCSDPSLTNDAHTIELDASETSLAQLNDTLQNGKAENQTAKSAGYITNFTFGNCRHWATDSGQDEFASDVLLKSNIGWLLVAERSAHRGERTDFYDELSDYGEKERGYDEWHANIILKTWKASQIQT